MTIILGNALDELRNLTDTVDLTFLDPPFNQGKKYSRRDDDLPEAKYWRFMFEVCSEIYDMTSEGGCIYFMQREKNVHHVISTLLDAGWKFRNLIIWKKLASAVPMRTGFGKSYQIIVYAIKGDKPAVFNKLKINPPLPPNYEKDREDGVFVTDCWDDIRELAAGYFAGGEVLRKESGARFHAQQAPINLLLRILLSSTSRGNVVLDPFAGTGTTAVVAEQLARKHISIEIDPVNVQAIRERLANIRSYDNILRHTGRYILTDELDKIW